MNEQGSKTDTAKDWESMIGTFPVPPSGSRNFLCERARGQDGHDESLEANQKGAFPDPKVLGHPFTDESEEE